MALTQEVKVGMKRKIGMTLVYLSLEIKVANQRGAG